MPRSISSGAIPTGKASCARCCLPKVTSGAPPPKRNNRLADALAARAAASAKPPQTRDRDPEQLHARMTFSAQERLSHRDFDTLSADEWRTLRHQIRSHRMPLATEPTRRLKAASHGTHADLRASARHAVRSGGDWTVWKYRATVERRPPLVLLLDISGSMSTYSRAVLYFCHALLQSRERLQVFLFGTRLTNATRALRERDPDVAIAGLSGSGGRLVGRNADRRRARRIQPALGAARAGRSRDRAARDRRARSRSDRRARCRDGAACALRASARVAQSTVAIPRNSRRAREACARFCRTSMRCSRRITSTASPLSAGNWRRWADARRARKTGDTRWN